jgi:hypothetical protein
MAFTVKQAELLGKPCFHFQGQIDEEAQFPQVSSIADSVVIDLQQVSAINSVGIRAWIMWFSQFPQTHFTFVNCPKALVMQMNMVEGFLPEKHDVLSLEVPFYCEDCDKEKEVLMTVGKEILLQEGQVKLNFDKSTICGEGCEPELDVSEVKFFRFLLTKSGSQAA